MKLLRIVPLVFLIAVGATACGKAKAKTAGEKLLDEAEANATAFCACKKEDEACMKKVSDAGEASEKAIEKEFPDMTKLPADLKKRMDAVEAKVKKCAEGGDAIVDPGSGSASGTAPPADQDKLLADMAALKDAVCKCADQACFDTEIKKGDDFEDRMKALWKDEASIPADINTKIEGLKQGVMDCAGKLGGGQAPQPPAGDPAAEATKILDEMTALTEEICKCTDMACAQPFGEKTEPLEQKLKELFPDKASVPAELMARGEEIEKKMQECVSKFPQ